MRYATFSINTKEPRLGVLGPDKTVIDVAPLIADAIGPATLAQLIAAGPQVWDRARALIDSAPADALDRYLLADVTLYPPLRPGKIIGVGLNYEQHVEESGRALDTAKERPERPVLFSKPGTAVAGHGQPIEHNGNLTAQLDWECELAVIIGRTAKRVASTDAMSYVFGYSIANDISARDQRRSGQWFYSKGQDTYAPFGPWVVTRDEIPDPQTLDLSLFVNDEQMQSGNTAQMIFPIAELIADITCGMTLEPGDVIITGSPEGVGAAKTPPRFLKPGDVVTAHIDQIGTLSNPVVDVR